MRFKHTELSFGEPILMGVLNLTPDSFSDGGQLIGGDEAVRRAKDMVRQGARILDVGGESTRPGAAPVSAEEEIARVLPTLEALHQAELPVVISIDTSKAAVAATALKAGAEMVNDVTALGDPAMAGLIAEAKAAVVLMHMRGEPRTMQEGPIEYDDVAQEVTDFLRGRAELAIDAGVSKDRLFVDPGLGFGKTLQHNLELTKRLDVLSGLGFPIVYGPSRKRFLGDITRRPVDDRDRATAAVCVAAVLAGAQILRVHNVAAVVDAARVSAALRDTGIRAMT